LPGNKGNKFGQQTGNKLATKIENKRKLGNKKEKYNLKVINKDRHLKKKRKIITSRCKIY
jgi:hypothetical protein